MFKNRIPEVKALLHMLDKKLKQEDVVAAHEWAQRRKERDVRLQNLSGTVLENKSIKKEK